MRYTDTTSTDYTGEYYITSHTTNTGGNEYYHNEAEEYFEDYEWMKEGWNKPYLKLLNLIVLKIIIPKARSLIQYQLKYPKHL